MKKTYQKAMAALCHLILFCAAAAAQNTDPETNRLAKLSEKLSGTYQVQVIDSRQYFSMPLAYFDSIQNTRHATETKYIRFNENIRIMVPSVATINSPGFTALTRVIYLNSKEN
ncbi:MAG: hypothetical protein ACXVPN_05790 [Bacteroidia bacterium]